MLFERRPPPLVRCAGLLNELLFERTACLRLLPFRPFVRRAPAVLHLRQPARLDRALFFERKGHETQTSRGKKLSCLRLRIVQRYPLPAGSPHGDRTYNKASPNKKTCKISCRFSCRVFTRRTALLYVRLCFAKPRLTTSR